MQRFETALLKWRQTHYRLAVRMLGQRRGTGYTEGVPYLQKTRTIPVFTATASRSSGRPAAGVYRWFLAWGAASTAAATMWAGVGKSGSPAPKPITSCPAALSDLALASTARVADSSMAAILR